MKKLFLEVTIVMAILAVTLSACDTKTEDYEVSENGEAQSYDNFDLVKVPTEDYIISCLESTPNILEVAAASEENDPNGKLNSKDGYYSAVFFSVDLLNQGELYGDELIDEGTSAGGCVEAYKTESDAWARDEYLSGYDDNWLLNAGYHTVVGTLVIRTSSELSENDQAQLEANIIDVLMGNSDSVTPLTGLLQNEEKAESNSAKSTSDEQDRQEKIITMPQGAADYIGSDWTIESLIEHFEKIGFTNIDAIPCEPNDDNYESNIFELYIETGWFNADPWEAGDEFKSNAEISIYYNEFPPLTVENCPDLVTALTSQDMSYTAFAEKYDGRYVKFNGYVTYHITYNAGIDHIIMVTGGDYDGSLELGHSDDGYYKGLNIYIGDRTMNSSIDKSVEEGEPVTISGMVDADWSEYYENLYVETICLSRR